jgi:uncharacterized protein YktA (UPF0223 family)
MKGKCLICCKPIKDEELALEVNDFILLVQGKSHEKCYFNSIKTGFTCYHLVNNKKEHKKEVRHE